MLFLTDGNNGDALFVDDIYTALPTTVEESKSRLACLDEIRAGAGDDLVDMTSQRFTYDGDGLVIRGGSGNDVIWANTGSNLLFGDGGNDRLVGATGDDVLAGGSGNDSMNGGGGHDIFTFCQNWGTDTVEQVQAEGSSVTLWFAETDSMKVSFADVNGNALFTHQDGSTVTVQGWKSTDVILKFGDDDSAQFDTLVDAGCFLEESSDKCYEETVKGVLAVI